MYDVHVTSYLVVFDEEFVLDASMIIIVVIYQLELLFIACLFLVDLKIKRRRLSF